MPRPQAPMTCVRAAPIRRRRHLEPHAHTRGGKRGGKSQSHHPRVVVYCQTPSRCVELEFGYFGMRRTASVLELRKTGLASFIGLGDHQSARCRDGGGQSCAAAGRASVVAAAATAAAVTAVLPMASTGGADLAAGSLTPVAVVTVSDDALECAYRRRVVTGVLRRLFEVKSVDLLEVGTIKTVVYEERLMRHAVKDEQPQVRRHIEGWRRCRAGYWCVHVKDRSEERV